MTGHVLSASLTRASSEPVHLYASEGPLQRGILSCSRRPSLENELGEQDGRTTIAAGVLERI